MRVNTTMDLGKDSILKLLIKFSIPAITGMLVNALYNMVDRVFISWGVGADAFSALTVTGPLTLIMLAFSMLVGIGAASSISIKLGEGNKDEAEKILGNAFAMLLATSFAVMTPGLIFLEEILYIFGAAKETISFASEYMVIMLYSFPFSTLGFGLYHITRASGNPTRAMISMLMGAVLNIILDYVFIFIFHWGIKGAAYATMISQAVAMFWVLSFFITRKSAIRLHTKNFKPNLPTLGRIYAIGISPFATQIAGSGVNALVNNLLLQYGGVYAMGAFGAVNMVVMIFAMPMFGMNQGAQPIVGFNYGAKQYKRVRHALYYTIFIAFILGCLGCLFAQTLAEPVVNFFTKGHEGINSYAVPALKIMMLLFPVGAVQIVSSIFFQAIGKAKITLFLSLLRQVILLIPLFFILPRFLGINGIWYSIPAADALSFIITMAVLYFGLKDLKEKEKRLQQENNEHSAEV